MLHIKGINRYNHLIYTQLVKKIHYHGILTRLRMSLMLALKKQLNKKSLDKYLHRYVPSDNTCRIKMLLDAGATPSYSDLKMAVFWRCYPAATVLLQNGLSACAECIDTLPITMNHDVHRGDPLSNLHGLLSDKEACGMCS